MSTLTPGRIIELSAREQALFVDRHPHSAALALRAARHMPGGVPMSWMIKWPGAFPIFVDNAAGAHFTDADGHRYIDFCLGDTGAMAGHSPAATLAAVQAQLTRGITTMLPTRDSITVAEELNRRFGLPFWQFTLTATDANRHAIRYARLLTGRRKIMVHNFCYHGSVDEAFATLDGAGRTIDRRSNIGPPVPTSETTVVVEFNDLAAVEAALRTGEIAAVLVEPALTNVGIVLPEPGYNDGLRELTSRYGAILINDETHTICAGPGGYTGAHGLTPDMLVIGKSIGGGIACGTFGMTAELSERIQAAIPLEDIDVGGIGGTLAGNGLSMAAMAATLTEVLTDEAFARMTELANAWSDGLQAVIDEVGAPWHVSRLGGRAEYGFSAEPPQNGAQAAAADALAPPDGAGGFELQQLLHLYALNRGILLTPFHNMALMSPATVNADVEAHTLMFSEVCAELFR